MGLKTCPDLLELMFLSDLAFSADLRLSSATKYKEGH